MAEAVEHDGVPTDGRRARRHRSRDLAVDALLDLLDEGVLRPTAQQVAERSGVSLRSIFRIFEDVQSLHEAATARHLSRVGHLFVPLAAEGDLPERVRATVESLAAVYEAVGPIRRAALRLAPESVVFQERLLQARSWLRDGLAGVFAEELTAPGAPPTRAAALEALVSFEAWDQLRTSQRLSAAAATEVLHDAAVALLA
jgi:AcrR family transcriptional regulator